MAYQVAEPWTLKVLEADEYFLLLQERMKLTEFIILQNNTWLCKYSKAAFTSLLALCLDAQFLETVLKYRNIFAAWALAFLVSILLSKKLRVPFLFYKRCLCKQRIKYCGRYGSNPSLSLFSSVSSMKNIDNMVQYLFTSSEIP